MSVHTHKGHCQLCDRLQAVNNKTGLLAKHGYTKRWSYFVGTCPGSDHKPYEKSALEIPPRIPTIEASIKSYELGIETVKNLAVLSPFYGNVSISRSLPKEQRTWGGRYEETHRAGGTFIEVSREKHPGYESIKVAFIPKEPITFKSGVVVTEVNSSELYRHGHFYNCHEPAEYAAKWRQDELAILGNHIHNNAQYRDWLVNRAASWKLSDLVPVKS